jgi:hypothetical protein
LQRERDNSASCSEITVSSTECAVTSYAMIYALMHTLMDEGLIDDVQLDTIHNSAAKIARRMRVTCD